jgi:cytochrome c
MNLSSVVAAVALMVTVPAFADQELAQKNGCLGCHAVDKKIVGPAYIEVAKKYAHYKGAAAKLFAKVKKGGRGVWGDVPMPPNPQVKDADLKQIIAWVLSLK